VKGTLFTAQVEGLTGAIVGTALVEGKAGLEKIRFFRVYAYREAIAPPVESTVVELVAGGTGEGAEREAGGAPMLDTKPGRRQGLL
jgi:hypothetical protein